MKTSMKTLCMVLALGATLMIASTTVATAAESNQSASGTTDPNFRWHNGKWWYWQAPQQRWMVWNGTEWHVHEPQTTVRTYRLQDSGNQGVRTGQSFRSRSNGGRITESFGIRDATSKIRGNY